MFFSFGSEHRDQLNKLNIIPCIVPYVVLCAECMILCFWTFTFINYQLIQAIRIRFSHDGDGLPPEL